MRRPNLIPAYRWLTMVTAGLVLLQALFAGRGLWLGNRSYIDYHEILANILFLFAVAQFVLVRYIGVPGALGKRLLMMNGLLAVLMIVQTGLGYVGRSEMEARAWHIPLGVLIFGLAVLISAMTAQLDAPAERAGVNDGS
ncbi:MAG: hypothetical protein KC438_12995 [Thermomicrobiales bacterium]|nr:hypothetical protein [Thermomicrobiales bacterium]MCO5221796.1 hypothetical protein [Thermomicrobiales bacterium]